MNQVYGSAKQWQKDNYHKVRQLPYIKYYQRQLPYIKYYPVFLTAVVHTPDTQHLRVHRDVDIW